MKYLGYSLEELDKGAFRKDNAAIVPVKHSCRIIERDGSARLNIIPRPALHSFSLDMSMSLEGVNLMDFIGIFSILKAERGALGRHC